MGKLALLFFFINSCLFNSQQIKFQYEADYIPCREESSRVKEIMTLNLNTVTLESFFESEGMVSNDGSDKSLEKVFHNKIHKRLKENKFLEYHSIAKKFYSATYEFDSKTWNISKEKRKINDISCQKATISFGKRKWEAWFSTDIPISDGPFKFSGLPGLIIEIKSLDGDYYFNLKKIINKADRYEIPKFTTITDQKLNVLINQVISDPSFELRKLYSNTKLIASAQYNGKELKVDSKYFDSFNKKYWQWMKSHNNYIEKDNIWVY